MYGMHVPAQRIAGEFTPNFETPGQQFAAGGPAGWDRTLGDIDALIGVSPQREVVAWRGGKLVMAAGGQMIDMPYVVPFPSDMAPPEPTDIGPSQLCYGCGAADETAMKAEVDSNLPGPGRSSMNLAEVMRLMDLEDPL